MLTWLRKPRKNSDGDSAYAGEINPDQVEKDQSSGFSFSTHAALLSASTKRAAIELKRYISENAFRVRPDAMRVVSQAGEITTDAAAMDSSIKAAYTLPDVGIPPQLMGWYIGQTFIGWQACAILAQHWLILKACSMPGKDAAQGGWTLTANDGEKFTPEQQGAFAEMDERYRVVENLIQSHQFREVFGIRHVLFLFEGMDYEVPFDPEMVKPGSYLGMSQIDPYWMSPLLDAEAVANPSNIDFYEPTYWLIAGRKYHKSHFVILRGPEVADILKPSYLYGGSPLPQRIYERVYAAERTANEAPELALTKRTTVRKVDLAEFIANEEASKAAIEASVAYKNNYGVSVIGLDEEVSQFDTTLNDLDAVIMTQYQLVAAIAEVPATKLLGTSPKGFGASGEYEIQSYHERCAGIQENDFSRILYRHYQACILSEQIGIDRITVTWNPLKQMTAKEIAELNKLKSDTDNILVMLGAIDGYDVRGRIAADEQSGYSGIEMPDESELEGGVSTTVSEEADDGEQA